MINKAQFQSLVRRILFEEAQKRLPEMNGNGVDPKKKNKTFPSDPNTRDTVTKEQMTDELKSIVNSIDKTWTVVWDDHDDIMVNGRDKQFLRITPLWEDNFKIVYYTRNEDRLFFTGLTWEQVKDFVRDNFEKKAKHTTVEKGRDRAWRNNEDQVPKPVKELSQKDKPKVFSTDQTFPTKVNKEKRYVEDQVKEEKDLPNQPMRSVEEFKKLSDHKVKPPVKLRRFPVNKKLIEKQK